MQLYKRYNTKLFILALTVPMLAFVFSLWLLDQKSLNKVSKNPKATSSNLLVDKNIHSLKSECESKCYNSGHTCAVEERLCISKLL